MTIYTNLPIYRATYSLLLEFSRMMPGMPRDSRFSIGQDMRHKIMEIIVLIYRASRTRHKDQIIGKMRDTLVEVQVYARLLCDMRHISQGQYTMIVEHTAGMSKQLAAWERNSRKNNSDEVAEDAADTCRNVNGHGF